MQVVIQNPGATDIPVSGLDIVIRAGLTTSPIDIAANRMSDLVDLMAKAAAGSLVVTVTPTAAEIASGFLAPPQSMQADDMAPVAAIEIVSGLILGRFAFTALAAGTPDNLSIAAVGATPAALKDKFRIINAWADIVTGIALSTLTLKPIVGGTQLAVVSSAAPGPQVLVALGAANASVVQTVSPTTGLILNRSDRGVAGEIFFFARRES